MTVRELSRLYGLRCEIRILEERLTDLRASLAPGSPVYDGMPHGAGSGSKTERVALAIYEIEQKHEAVIEQAKIEMDRLHEYIDGIPDSMTKNVFRCRFLYNMSWAEVAAKIGGGNTEDSVKKRCYRYLAAEKEAEDGEIGTQETCEGGTDPGEKGKGISASAGYPEHEA